MYPTVFGYGTIILFCQVFEQCSLGGLTPKQADRKMNLLLTQPYHLVLETRRLSKAKIGSAVFKPNR